MSEYTCKAQIFFSGSLSRCRHLGSNGRHILKLYLLSWFFLILSTTSVLANNQPGSSMDYSRLLEFIKIENIENPLYPLNVFEKKLDTAVHQSNLSYIEDHPDLLDRIRRALDATELQWNLENFRRRLVFVPETREEYASLFKSYCTDVINYALEKTQLQNPFSGMTNLLSEMPQLPESNDGIAIFLVHNLAEESIYTYAFSNPQKKKVVIDLDQKSFIGEVGSYTSRLSQTDDGDLEFVRNKFTIWQNSAKNPYTVLMVPVEETFHITLRDYTEHAIRERLKHGHASPTNSDEIRRVVEEWIAVEEAIAGGLVHGLLPEFLSKAITAFRPDWIKSDLNSKSTMKRYRYLKKGIQTVEKLGIKKSIQLYRKNPHAFRDLLL